MFHQPPIFLCSLRYPAQLTAAAASSKAAGRHHIIVMAAKRLSSLFSLPDRSERPTMSRHASSPAVASREPSPPNAPRSRSPAPGKLQKAVPNQPRAASGPFLDPGQPSLQDLQQQVSASEDAAAPVLPPPTFGHNFSRPSSRDGSRPNTSSSARAAATR